MTALLAEVSEQAAHGSVAATYAEIRRILGVPMVVLVYRALAVQPGRLEHVWSALAANLAAGETQRTAASLDVPEIGGVEPLPGRLTCAIARLDPVRLAGTLDCFDHANRLNLIGLTALLLGAPGNPDADPRPAPPAMRRALLPMADLTLLPRSSVELLQRMSAPITKSERPVVIPSLFRYFAHDPDLLEAIGKSLEPAVLSDGFTSAVTAVTERARDLAGTLPYPVARVHDDGTREITTRFITTIPAMIVATKLLRLVLHGRLGEAAGETPA